MHYCRTSDANTENTTDRITDAGKVVRLQGQHEVLVALWLGLLFSSIGRKPEVKVSSDKIQTAYIFS